MKTLRALKSLKKYYHKDRKNIFVLTVLIFISSFVSLVFAAIWGLILNSLMQAKFFEAVIFLLLELVTFLGDTALQASLNYFQAKIEMSMVKDIQFDIYKKILDYPAVAFEEHGVGEMNNRIHGDTQEIVNLFSRFVSMLGNFTAAFVIIFIFIKINIILSIEVILFAIVIFLTTKYFTPKMKQANKIVKEENDNLMRYTTQSLTGIREVKALGIKKQIYNVINDKFTNKFKRSYDAEMTSTINMSVALIVYALFEFITLFTGAFLFYKELISITVIVLIYNYLNQINWTVRGYTEFTKDYQKLSVAIDRIKEILNEEMYKPENFGVQTLNNMQGLIEFKDVDLKYYNDEKETLHNFSLTIKPHLKTAIVGASGSGKTSIFNVLLRYFNATGGAITIDGIPLEEISEESLRDNISVIRQDTFLFNMSIMDNFKMVKEDVTLKEVRKVCKQAYIDSYIMDLPNGYDTIIGENGVNLSGGQKQRISIARALLKNSKIMLFDEATSALDNKSQEYIKKTMDELVKDHTIIIIAHRLSTIVDADEIVLMEKGKIIDSGTHKKLMKNPKYKELYKADIMK